MTETRQERTEMAYHDLVRFVHWLAYRYQVVGNWTLNYHDLVAEGFLVISKMSNLYYQKPYNEQIAMTRTAIQNHYNTLHKRVLKTYRQYDSPSDDTDYEVEYFIPGQGKNWSDGSNEGATDPAILYDQIEKYREVAAKFTDFDKEVFDCIFGNNERVPMYLELARARRNWVFNDPKIRITPHIIARALNVDPKAVLASYERMRPALIDVV